MPDKKAFKIQFNSHVNVLPKEETDKYFAQASLAGLTSVMPKEIDLDHNSDLIGIVLNSAVGNMSNKNYMAIHNKDLVDIGRNFKWKMVDIEHDRRLCVGVICNYGFSKFLTNEILTEEEATESTDPVNLTLALLVWSRALDYKYRDILVNSSSPNSEHYQKISGSWELLLTDCDIGISPDFNISNAKIYSGEEKNVYEQHLPIYGGSGRFEGNYVFQIVKNDNEDWVLPTGIGLVEHPAALVKGLEIVNKPDERVSIASITKEEIINIIQETIKNKEEQISKTQNVSVKQNDSTKIFMPLTKITDLTQENIKEVLASDVQSLFEKAAKEASDKWEAEKTRVKDLQVANEKLAADLNVNSQELDTLRKQIGDIEAKAAEKDKSDNFQKRMSIIDDRYVVSEKQKPLLAKEIAELDQAESVFAAYLDKLDAFLVTKVQASEIETKSREEKEKLVREALASAKPANTNIPNSETAADPSLVDKYKKAFSTETIKVQFSK